MSFMFYLVIIFLYIAVSLDGFIKESQLPVVSFKKHIETKLICINTPTVLSVLSVLFKVEIMPKW